MKLYCVLLLVFHLAALCQCRCDAYYAYGVSDAESTEIVNFHNYIRQLISEGRVPNQPRGTNLKTLKYDAQLGAAAQQISNSCEFQHQSVSDSRWGWVGQNLYLTASTAYDSDGANWTNAINGWYSEYESYTFGQGFNHYTQVVWANTEYVGCGYTYYLDNSDEYSYKKFYTCNYGPGGNIDGQLPYET